MLSRFEFWSCGYFQLDRGFVTSLYAVPWLGLLNQAFYSDAAIAPIQDLRIGLLCPSRLDEKSVPSKTVMVDM